MNKYDSYQNAAPIVAGKLIRAAGQRMLRAQAATIVLILAAVAVLLLVTLPALRNAGSIRALVLTGRAERRLLWAVLLVAPIAAVIVPITPEPVEYALTTGTAGATQAATALELALGTTVDHRRALVLVGVVVAVGLAVAAEGQGDAVAVVAGEVLVRAAGAVAVRLVGEVLAVVLAVTEPGAGNAEAVEALELILGAVGARPAMGLVRVVAAVVVAVAQPVLADAAIGARTHHMDAGRLAVLLQVGHLVGSLLLRLAGILVGLTGILAVGILLARLAGIVLDQHSQIHAERLLFVVRPAYEPIAAT